MLRSFVPHLLLVLLCWAHEAPAAAQESPPKEKEKAGKPRFTIGKETTRVLGPVDKAGYIDYEAALNGLMRQGVTPKNNANVLLWRAFGPHPEKAEMPPAFFRWLEIEPPPDNGDYFVDAFEFLRERRKVPQEAAAAFAEKLSAEITFLSRRPWKAADFPDHAAWLKANAKPLDLVVQASGRSRYFNPLVSRPDKEGRKLLIGALLPGVQKTRSFAQALTERAMLHLGEGKVDEAWQDLLACHRLGRLVSQGGTLIEGLVGIAIDQIASEGDQAFLAFADADAARLKKCARDLRALPSLAPLARLVDRERFLLLDGIMALAHGGTNADVLQALGGGSDGGGTDLLSRLMLAVIDWDPALRIANEWYDRMVAVLGEMDRAVRQKKLTEIESDLRKLRGTIAGPGGFLKSILSGKDFGENVGRTLGNVLVTMLVPAVTRISSAYDRTEQNQRNLQVAFALAVYRKEQGRYPKALADLVPKYLEKVPQDTFSGRALHYRPTATGYLSYSVGPDGKDGGGQGYDDDPRGDDLRIRMPLPKLSPLPPPAP